VTLECINPDGIHTPETYSHVVIARGTQQIFIAGQVAEDEHGNLVGADDMTAQATQVFANIGRALTAAGARPEDVAKLTIFVANYRREHLPMIEQGRVTLFGAHKPTDSLVGVAALSSAEYMLEVDAVAVVELLA
jgi:enamine deaminase RidA (YjgF/YER057c/UK114 family)